MQQSKYKEINKSFVMKLNTGPKNPNSFILNALYRELEGEFKRERKKGRHLAPTPRRHQARAAWGIQGVQDSRRPRSLKVGHHQNRCKAVSEVAHLQGVEE